VTSCTCSVDNIIAPNPLLDVGYDMLNKETASSYSTCCEVPVALCCLVYYVFYKATSGICIGAKQLESGLEVPSKCVEL